MSSASKPVAKVSLFPISAAIWRNEKDGRPYYSVTFERSYKEDDGKWKNTSSFNAGELLLLAKVADMAHTEITNLRSNDRDFVQSDA
jgi:hypothetical protein